MSIDNILGHSDRPEGDLLDPVQLGFVYESILLNAGDKGLNSPRSKPYVELSEWYKKAIDDNCGCDDYISVYQPICRRMADYDGRMKTGETQQ